MTDHTPEFLAQFPKAYGRYDNVPPSHDRCAGGVYSGIWGGFKQCARKNGHGPHGAWCKLHDPVAAKAKSAARDAADKLKRDETRRRSEFEAACKAAIREIAAGHNDPRGLAQSIIDKLEGRSE